MTTPAAVTSKARDTAVSAAGLMTVAQVCRSIRGARGNDTLSPSTVTRWILSGCPSRGGERVTLAAVRVGGRWMVAPEALEAFFAALASTGPSPAAESG